MLWLPTWLPTPTSLWPGTVCLSLRSCHLPFNVRRAADFAAAPDPLGSWAHLLWGGGDALGCEDHAELTMNMGLQEGGPGGQD